MPTHPTLIITSAAELEAFLRSRIATSLPGMRSFMRARDADSRTARHWKGIIGVSLQSLLSELITSGVLRASVPLSTERMQWISDAASKLDVTLAVDTNGEEIPWIDVRRVCEFVFPTPAVPTNQRRVPLSNFVASVMGQSRSQTLSYPEMERGLERRALREVLRPSGVSEAVAAVAKEVQEELSKEEQQQKQQEKLREVAASGLGRVIDID